MMGTYVYKLKGKKGSFKTSDYNSIHEVLKGLNKSLGDFTYIDPVKDPTVKKEVVKPVVESKSNLIGLQIFRKLKSNVNVKKYKSVFKDSMEFKLEYSRTS